MSWNTDSIVTNIRKLGAEDAQERTRAREALESIGRPATWHLIQAAVPRGKRTRREALKGLVNLADPAATDLFVELLEDEDSDCRWLAAEGLAALGEAGLQRALEILIAFPRTDHLLRSLHHVLSSLKKAGYEEVAAPVLRAFRGEVPETRLPTAAHAALNALRRARHARSEHSLPTAR